MNDCLRKKVIKLAAEICWMHGSLAGNRVCQDWRGETDTLESLTETERNELMYSFEQYNSNGEGYELGYFPFDEMVISFLVGHALEQMA